MEYMGAGSVPVSFEKQIDEVLRLKKNNPDTCFPFVFVDPRRIRDQEKDKTFLKFKTQNPDALELDECLLKEYLDGGCCGIKIYPALGYYPFDKSLLPLWLYCAQNDIPITTHCSVGPIFYRGNLKDLGPNYDLHPIFEEVYDNDEEKKPIIIPLRLAQIKNKDFQRNFTHPLNYLCLIHKSLLVKVIEHFDDSNDLKELFGYKDGNIERDLGKLKINLAHYGSAEQMERFLKKDRYDESNFIINRPEALDLKTRIDNLSDLYQFWHYVDWFSIISSMMKEFENIYTDVSYTAHESEYLNLISEIMNDDDIGDRILFGTDFYVVSNHKTEKEFWIDMRNRLEDEKWKKMSLDNPKRFLNL
jgi:predicted TIM-barrel fold metal-dependent hydrolase